jgi:hypothetical protein
METHKNFLGDGGGEIDFLAYDKINNLNVDRVETFRL